MSEPIVPRSLVHNQARRAVESGQPIHHFEAWPIGTAAGQLFQQEVRHLLNLREASDRAREGAHG